MNDVMMLDELKQYAKEIERAIYSNCNCIEKHINIETLLLSNWMCAIVWYDLLVSNIQFGSVQPNVYYTKMVINKVAHPEKQLRRLFEFGWACLLTRQKKLQ